MATTEHSEYSEKLLPQLQPSQAVDILNARVAQIGRLNAAVSEWLQERRRLEEQYSLGLRRLAQRPLDAGDLGVFAVPWSTLMSSADTLANSHSAFANKIETDVERPLRDFNQNSREMTAMSTVQGNLQALARDVTQAQQKTDKLRGKGDRAESSKIASASSDFDSAQSHWQSQAPYIFENLQTLDEVRIGNLRDALTQFQTHEMDQIERNRVSGEQCLNVLLNVETADEIKTFALKAAEGKVTPPRLSSRQSVAVSHPGGTSTGVSAPIQSEDDFAPGRSTSTDDVKQKGRFKGGLKRFGTVMGRKRESKMPAELSSPAESPASRPRPSPLARFRSRDNAPQLDTMQETSPQLQRPRSPPRLGSEIFQSPSEARDTPSTPAVGLGVDSPQINGTSSTAPVETAGVSSSRQAELSEIEAPVAAVIPERKESLAALEGRTDSEGFNVPSRDLDPISQAQQEAALADDGSTPSFNVNIRDAPIHDDTATSGTDLASMANRLQAPPPSTKRSSTVRGRRQDRSSFVNNAVSTPEQTTSEAETQPPPSVTREIAESQPEPIQTAPPSNQSAFGIGSTGLVQSPSGTFAPGQAAASTFSPFASVSENQSPQRPEPRTAANVDQPRTDTQSIRSATTTGSQGAATKHPDFTESGLNSSIVETISARFENGKLMSSSLIGEIALAYNPADFSSPFGTENIRIENFASLEKIAPNPAFVNQLPDRNGEYGVNLSSIARTQVAFKYQLRLDETSSSAPLLITPAFKIEQNQCSVIISYSLNPAFALHSQESISLSNVMLALTLEGTKTTGCQSRPVGTFSREKNLIYWQLNDITLSPGAVPEKLLARFATESDAKGGSVEGRWEILADKNAEILSRGLNLSVQSSVGDGSDPFADESAGGAAGNWKPVKGVKRMIGGGYFAK